ncbi:MaoC family dehydratase N-terminal domain-containing protein [Limnohabitans sp. 2KL-51]|jgi:hypothetical protein|uniref:FAS1-like dehydratase domain-containing protein n=1 Tax=Limnohabitans sp. 2KL-51 TaxID=1977911 RepID=UPI000D334FC8|nr:hypothetical protein B9Z49_03605 [Limnohabitans sp. 2KL-51]
MKDARNQGSWLSPFEGHAARPRLQAFDQAIGQTDPLNYGVQAAQAMGHPDLLISPNWFLGLEWGPHNQPQELKVTGCAFVAPAS